MSSKLLFSKLTETLRLQYLIAQKMINTGHGIPSMKKKNLKVLSPCF